MMMALIYLDLCNHVCYYWEKKEEEALLRQMSH